MLAFLLFAVVSAVTPGPSNIMLTAAGARAGVVRGLPCLLGVTTGMALMMFLVPFGLASLVLGHPLALEALRYGGAAFLLWLSWKLATAPEPADARPEREPIGYLGAAALQWINPKSWLVSAGAAATFLNPEAASPAAQAASLAGLFFVAALPSCFVWLALGAGIHRPLDTPRRRRVFNVAMGGLLVLSVALIVR